MDGLELARFRKRESAPQIYVPIVVVSGDVEDRLHSRTLGEHVTDYFDKSLGFQALAEFIRGYVQPARRRAEGTARRLRRGQPRGGLGDDLLHAGEDRLSPCAMWSVWKMRWRCWKPIAR